MFRSLLALGSTLFLLGVEAKASPKTDLSLYGALPMVEDVQISPDGSKLAVITTDGDNRYLTVRKTLGGGITGVAVGAHKLRGVTWAGEDHVLLLSSMSTEGMYMKGRPREYFTLSDFDLKMDRQRTLLESSNNAMNIVVGQPQVRTIKGETVVFLEGVRFMRGVGADTLFSINLRTRALRMLDHGARFDSDAWLVDANGEPLAQSLYDSSAGRWSLLMKVGSNWKTIEKADAPMGSYGVAGLGRDGKSVLVWRRGDQQVLTEYRPDSPPETLPDEMAYSGLLHDPVSQKLLGGYGHEGDDLVYRFFDAEDQRAWLTVTKPFKTDRVALQSWSNDRRRLVVRVDSPTQGLNFYFVDLNTRQALPLGPVYKGLSPAEISPVRTVRYDAADGLKINAYLTLPKDRAPQNLPLIVLPHGGPEGRDTLGFDWWSQALASRGYAVLRPNFRGSDGYGAEFVRAGFDQWGRKMQTDLSDGVLALAREGVIDPKRVCIVGASYGGYAALAGATSGTGVYRCAVSVAGPSDLKRIEHAVAHPGRTCQTNYQSIGSRRDSCPAYGTGPANLDRLLRADPDARDLKTATSPRYWLRFMGVGGDKQPDLDAISPVTQAAKADIPILLIHGEQDTVVPIEQSQIMAEALKKAGKPVELITLKGEDHWLSSGTTRLQMLTETVAFLEKHNPPE